MISISTAAVLLSVFGAFKLISATQHNLICQPDNERDPMYWGARCTVAPLNISNQSDQLIFPDEKIVLLNKPTVPEYLSPELLANLSARTEYLHIYDGDLPQVYLKPTLEVLKMLDGQTHNLIIDNEDNQKLIKLVIRNNKLLKVPDNIDHLKKLIHLNLQKNVIKEINLSQLNGLSMLKLINLDHNKIEAVHYDGPVNLPALERLVITKNKLKALDVRALHVSNLNALDLFNNKLRFVIGLDKLSEKLAALQLQYNPLDCGWVEDMGVLFQQKERVPCKAEHQNINRYCCNGDKSGSNYQQFLRKNGSEFTWRL